MERKTEKQRQELLRKLVVTDLLFKIFATTGTEEKREIIFDLRKYKSKPREADLEANQILKYFIEEGEWIEVKLLISRNNPYVSADSPRKSNSVVTLYKKNTGSDADIFLHGLEIPQFKSPGKPTEIKELVDVYEDESGVVLEDKIVRELADLSLIKNYRDLLGIFAPFSASFGVDKIAN